MKIKLPVVALLAAACIAAPAFPAAAAGTEEQSDATPEVSQPKAYSEKEIDAMDPAKLKSLADAGQAGQGSALATFMLAQKARAAGDGNGAAAGFAKLVKEFPRHYLAPKALVELAAVHREAKAADQEIAALTDLSEKYPEYRENAAGLYRLAEIHRERKALDDMRKTLETLEVRFASLPEAVPGLFFSANEYLRNYNSAKAIEKFDMILAVKEITPVQRAQALMGKAAAHEYAGRAAEAGPLYNEAAKVAGDEKVVAAAKKFRENLAKAPKEALVKIEPPKDAEKGGGRQQAQPGAQEAPKTGRVTEAPANDAGKAATTETRISN